MVLVRARSQASARKWAAFGRYYADGATDEDRTIAERDFRAAEAELEALPGLVSPEAIARLRAGEFDHG